MFFFAGFLEWGLFKQDSKRAPGDFENVGDLGVPFSEGVQDPEDRKSDFAALRIQHCLSAYQSWIMG